MISEKPHGIIRAYASNTYRGNVRNYNEDRVTILLDIPQPESYRGVVDWPRVSFFGIFDGHGGAAGCADFLRDNLHEFVIQDENFPEQVIYSIKKGFRRAEEKFTSHALRDGKIIDKSGSCAVVALIVGNPAPLIPRSLIHR